MANIQSSHNNEIIISNHKFDIKKNEIQGKVNGLSTFLLNVCYSYRICDC